MRTRMLLLVLVAASLAAAADWTKKFTVTGKPGLRVDSNDASVEVRSGATGAIEVRVIAEGWKIGSDEVRVTDRQIANRVELEVRIPSGHWGSGHRSVRVEVTAPRETAAEIHTGDGRILVQGLHGDTRLVTGDGSITAEALDGSLDARTGDGRIVVRGRFDLLNLRTDDGSIEAEVQPGSKVAAGWRIQTGDGSVRLRLAPDLAADLDVHTGDGSISSELPVAVSGSRSESSLRGKLNGGGLPLTVRTGDGSIHLDRL
ncbi:MAG: DUF4097 family beta strand repeat-containing protein [Bryobacteraceae bacterium]